jgi:hypothetical protein
MNFELEINEEITIDNNTYKCIEDIDEKPSCKKCIMWECPHEICMSFPCTSKLRKDKKNVYFLQVSPFHK